MILKLLKYAMSKFRYIARLMLFYYIRIVRHSIVTNTHHCKGKSIRFYAPSFRSFVRSIDAHHKEPMTRVWIEGMKPSDTLWDIGANVGVFTLLAAYRNVNVVAFEPLYSNYYVLAKNVELNKTIAPNVIILPIALSDSTGIKSFYVPDSDPGYSGSSYGIPVDQDGNPLNYSLEINMPGIRGEDLINLFKPSLPMPTHIKLDVDGIEDKILHGLDGILSDQNVRSVLVESSEEYTESHAAILDRMKTNNFSLHQTESANPLYKDCPCYNYIFARGA